MDDLPLTPPSTPVHATQKPVRKEIALIAQIIASGYDVWVEALMHERLIVTPECTTSKYFLKEYTWLEFGLLQGAEKMLNGLDWGLLRAIEAVHAARMEMARNSIWPGPDMLLYCWVEPAELPFLQAAPSPEVYEGTS